MEVACLLHDVGAADHVIAAGLLHDVIENTDADADDLRKRFGSSIAGLVVALQRGQTHRRLQQTQGGASRAVSTAGSEALTVFAADKLAKVPLPSYGPSLAAGGRLAGRRVATTNPTTATAARTIIAAM
jgi:(p)ppGpp synthase/HD superfamily hydrolase